MSLGSTGRHGTEAAVGSIGLRLDPGTTFRAAVSRFGAFISWRAWEAIGSG